MGMTSESVWKKGEGRRADSSCENNVIGTEDLVLLSSLHDEMAARFLCHAVFG